MKCTNQIYKPTSNYLTGVKPDNIHLMVKAFDLIGTLPIDVNTTIFWFVAGYLNKVFSKEALI